MTNPPTPAEMPKPDTEELCMVHDLASIGIKQRCWYVKPDGTTSIERAYIEQHVRAEKYKAELVYKQDHIDEEVEINKMLQAENERLREDRDAHKAFFDWMKIHHPGCCKAYYLAALHPTTDSTSQADTTKGDEDE
jgi:hypothetical protein